MRVKTSLEPQTIGSTRIRNHRLHQFCVDHTGSELILDVSVVALSNECVHLRSLGLYYCQNITDLAMYSLAESRSSRHPKMQPMMKVSTTRTTAGSSSSRYDNEGLKNLNISQCTALTPGAVQAVCDSFPALHTCPGRHSLIISGCLSLTSVHCACASLQSRRPSILPSVPLPR